MGERAGMPGEQDRRSRLPRVLFWVGIALLAIALAVAAAFRLSPWPGALLIRHAFDKGAAATSEALAKHVPPGIAEMPDLRYDPADDDAYLDVYFPASVGEGERLITVVWIHGGGWVSGTKNDIGNYARILAARGYTVVGVDYSIAPGATYPTPVRQLNAALGYLAANATRLHIDPNRFVLAGDSGGSHIVAQVANVVSVPSYAGLLGIRPAIDRGQLAGMLLFCGAYDMNLADFDGPFGGFLHTVLWAYSGTKDFRTDPAFESASVLNHVTGAFPPSFISAGNADPLAPQSVAMADALRARGVRVDALFFAADHQPPLPHEYQFDLDGKDGRLALDRAVAFLRALP